MKNAETEQDDDLRPEYDFSEMKGGVRGKYVERYREGLLDGPAELEPSAELMATVLAESSDEERDDWTRLSLESLARAYGDDEPEYLLDTHSQGVSGDAKAIPEGWHSITPRLVADDAAALVEFLKQAFGATGEFRSDRPSIIKIGDSLVMVSSIVTSTAPREATAAFLYLYVDDIDTTYQRALRAGAVSLEEPQDLPYGDRRAMVQDPCGNIWQIATYKLATQDRNA